MSRFFKDLTGAGSTFNWRANVLVPLLAILSALIAGGVIIALGDLDTLKLWGSDPGQAFSDTFNRLSDAYVALFKGAFWGLGPISETLTRAAPLILAGLAVAVGFQAGLFNIGANGQMLIGGMFALVVGFQWDLPIFIHIPIAIVAALIGGAIWGGIPGYLRAKTGAHEVITTIMLNFIALRLVDYLLTVSFFQLEGRSDPVSKSVLDSARYPKLIDFINARYRVHLGIIIALLAAWFIWWLLYRSTIGFEFRAVGANPDGARYAGMNVVWLIVAVMAVAGAMAGLAGGDQVLGTLGRATPGFVGVIGFDAIALALLGRSHPFGVVAAGVLFGGLAAGGQAMQVATDVGVDIVTVIQALIIVFIAAPALIKAIYRVKADTESAQLTSGWAT
ncbi:MAG: ABC transporter permease [Acidimicrobiia bacterium]|nr:ABC transporter permease [Acidimicrobiia bacterium]NNJ48492.1 ABC transporter permease [Acidimicrobiia bacterium]NNL13568.1 ABC transporter permease [Acidimicrobiia bacterium]